ncbi:hypothetical protein BSKO_04980 [Bryopsis sp. KO-2023]|nr:hypothetical protein BSKO_04980 [Bryopsis sp. KO-2023]
MFRAFLQSAGRSARILAADGRGAAYVACRRSSGAAQAVLKGKEGSSEWSHFLGLAALGGASMMPFAFASPRDERSFIMIKPDGVQRGLVAEIIRRFESKGYKLVGIKAIVPTKDLASSHYDEHNGKPFFPKLVDFLSSGPCIAMVWEGKDVITYGRKMIGATNPSASEPGTIRGDYAIEMGRNIIHGSDSTESAQKEIALWFKSEELADYTPCAKSWVYE